MHYAPHSDLVKRTVRSLTTVHLMPLDCRDTLLNVPHFALLQTLLYFDVSVLNGATVDCAPWHENKTVHSKGVESYRF